MERKFGNHLSDSFVDKLDQNSFRLKTHYHE